MGRRRFAGALARERGRGELMTQADEGFLNRVVAADSAEQECQKVDRRLPQPGKSRRATGEIDAKKSCCHRYRLYEIHPIQRNSLVSRILPSTV